MSNTYDPSTTLAAMDDNMVPILLFGGICIISMWVFFFEAARMGHRDRVYPLALWMTVAWWPHDGLYLLEYDKWFRQYKHWYLRLFWAAIVVTFLSESVYLAQTVRFGRVELSPGRSWAVHCLRVGGALLAGVACWAVVKGAVRDDLYLISGPAMLLLGCPAGSSMLAARPNGRGQSVLEWVGFTLMTVFYSVISVGYFGGGFFHSLQYVGLCFVASVWSVILTYDVYRAGAVFSSLERPLTLDRRVE